MATILPWLVGALSTLPAPSSLADGVRLLEEFVESHDKGNVAFLQESFDENGEMLASTSGELWFIRPDRFRLEYFAPEEQVIIGNGERIWHYDPLLRQVIVRPFDEQRSVGALSLLTGGAALKGYIITSAPAKDGVHVVVHAIPLDREQTFEDVWIAFERDSGVLSHMEIRDVFANTLVLDFLEIRELGSEQVFEVEFPEGTSIFEDDG